MQSSVRRRVVRRAAPSQQPSNQALYKQHAVDLIQYLWNWMLRVLGVDATRKRQRDAKEAAAVVGRRQDSLSPVKKTNVQRRLFPKMDRDEIDFGRNVNLNNGRSGRIDQNEGFFGGSSRNVNSFSPLQDQSFDKSTSPPSNSLSSSYEDSTLDSTLSEVALKFGIAIDGKSIAKMSFLELKSTAAGLLKEETASYEITQQINSLDEKNCERLRNLVFDLAIRSISISS
jgi:hypothetical protein